MIVVPMRTSVAAVVILEVKVAERKHMLVETGAVVLVSGVVSVAAAAAKVILVVAVAAALDVVMVQHRCLQHPALR